MKKICVIMPSYLGDYEGAATNRKIKFLRAVKTFIFNNHNNKYLIIVADGCDETVHLYKENFQIYPNIMCLNLPKQSFFSGNVRQAGVNYAISNLELDIICYLDSDDMLLHDHLSQLDSQFNGYDWVYFDDTLKFKDLMKSRVTKLEKNHIGTSNIAHKPLPEFNWIGDDGYGHDFSFISNKLMKNKNYAKIQCNSYLVCHNPNLMDT